MAKRKKTQYSPHIEALMKRDLSPLKLTKAEAEFLNKVKAVADKAEENAKKGGNGNAYYPVAVLVKLELLAGKNPASMKVWEKQRAEFKMRYPVGTHLIYNDLRFIRMRIKAYQEAQAKEQEQKNEQ